MEKDKIVCIGIDESYQDTGITINYNNGEKIICSHLCFEEKLSKTEKRRQLAEEVISIISGIDKYKFKGVKEIIIIVERIRQFSAGFISMNYIKAMAALIANIVDVAFDFSIKVYSVDTRCWKANIVGTSKPEKNNIKCDPKKWPTIKWCISQGFEECIIDKTKKCGYNDNVADSIAISYVYWNKKANSTLKIEE